VEVPEHSDRSAGRFHISPGQSDIQLYQPGQIARTDGSGPALAAAEIEHFLGLGLSPFQVSFIPGFGTHPKGNVEVDVSLNILAGRIARVNQFELGTLLNWETGSMSGLQLCGLVNFVEGSARGVQLGGLANVVMRNASSVALAGLVNYTGGEVDGLSFAGLANFAESDMTGIYAAGIANGTVNSFTGIGLSGIANYAEDESTGILLAGIANCSLRNSTGIYLAGLTNCSVGPATGIILSGLLNYSDNFDGIEVSLVNVARDVEGIQAGLINYARSVDGIPFGFLSYVEEVPLRFDAWISETAALSMAVRSGNGRYYPLLAFGINPYDKPFHWMAGWGFGKEYYLQRDGFADLDVILYYVGFEDRTREHTDTLYKLRLIYGRNLIPHLAIYGGLTLNLLATDIERAEDVALWGPSEPTWTKGSRNYYFWPGLVLGVRF